MLDILDVETRLDRAEAAKFRVNDAGFGVTDKRVEIREAEEHQFMGNTLQEAMDEAIGEWSSLLVPGFAAYNREEGIETYKKVDVWYLPVEGSYDVEARHEDAEDYAREIEDILSDVRTYGRS